jgi:hypothetical protein
MKIKLSIEVLKSLFIASSFDYKKENLMVKCPWCGVNEFGVSLSEGHRFNCFRKKKCGESGNAFKLLQKLGRLDLIENHGLELIKYDEKLINIIERKIEDSNLDLAIETIKPPLGFKRAYSNFYLEDRGFELFDKFEVGITKLDSKLRDHVIILIKENQDLKGYVARIALNKKQLKALEEKLGRKVPRYKNSSTDFTKLLGGYDELTPNTHTVILTEGLLGKENIDKKLELDSQEEIKCCCTFGAKISAEQIFKLQLKGIKNIILFFDIDVINKIKQYTMEYLNEFDSVQIAYSEFKDDNGGDKDPADLDIEEMDHVFNHLEDPIQFYFNKIQVLNLK